MLKKWLRHLVSYFKSYPISHFCLLLLQRSFTLHSWVQLSLSQIRFCIHSPIVSARGAAISAVWAQCASAVHVPGWAAPLAAGGQRHLLHTAEPAETHCDWPPHIPHYHYTPAAGEKHRHLNTYPGTTQIKHYDNVYNYITNYFDKITHWSTNSQS